MRFTTSTAINIPVFKGLCMVDICNADVLNQNKLQAYTDITDLLAAIGNFIKRLIPK